MKLFSYTTYEDQRPIDFIADRWKDADLVCDVDGSPIRDASGRAIATAHIREIDPQADSSLLRYMWDDEGIVRYEDIPAFRLFLRKKVGLSKAAVSLAVFYCGATTLAEEITLIKKVIEGIESELGRIDIDDPACGELRKDLAEAFRCLKKMELS